MHNKKDETVSRFSKDRKNKKIIFSLKKEYDSMSKILYFMYRSFVQISK